MAHALVFHCEIYVVLCVLVVAPLPVQAQTTISSAGAVSSGALSATITVGQAAVEQYWTPQRLLNAKPVELHPPVGADGLPIAPQGLAETAAAVGEGGVPPLVEVPPTATRVLIPPGMLPELQAQNGVSPFATSSFGAFFTTSRVFPNKATKTY